MPRFASIIVCLLFAMVGVLVVAAGPARLGPAAGQEFVGEIPSVLPKVVRGVQTETVGARKALRTLSFDDGTCEGGLGLGAPHTSLVDFDVPVACTQPGFLIAQVTARINTLTATAFTLRQGGTNPGLTASGTRAGISSITGVGPCPATGGLMKRAITPGLTVTGTSNFFAGVNHGPDGGFVGFDTDGVRAMRHWINCPWCAQSIYSPAELSGIGFAGNFMIRVTGEDMNCVPVELIEFTVKSE